MLSKALHSNLYRPLFRGLSAGEPAITRYFTELSSAGQKYYTLSTAIDVDRVVMDVDSPSGITTGLPTGATTPTANKLTTLDFTHSGIIQHIGRNGSDYFDGVPANVKMYKSGVLLVDMAIAENFANTTIVDNKQTVLGSDLATISASSVASGWTETSIKNYSLDGTCAAFSRVSYNTMLTIGVVYKLVLKITNHVSGDCYFNSSSFNSDNLSGNGTLTIIYTATHQEIRLRTTAANAEYDVEFISAEEIPAANPLAITNNITASESYTKNAAGTQWDGADGSTIVIAS